MALVMISVDREKLPEHSDQEFESWVKYQVGALAGISNDNPMVDIDLEAQVLEVG